MKLYRIQSLSNESMWYSFDGKFTDKIKSITGQSIPMPFESFRQEDKKVKLLSSCEDIEMFPNWFTQKQLVKLFNSGYSLFQYDVDSCIYLPKGECLFDYEKANGVQEIDMDLIIDHFPDVRETIK